MIYYFEIWGWGLVWWWWTVCLCMYVWDGMGWRGARGLLLGVGDDPGPCDYLRVEGRGGEGKLICGRYVIRLVFFVALDIFFRARRALWTTIYTYSS